MKFSGRIFSKDGNVWKILAEEELLMEREVDFQYSLKNNECFN